MVKTEDLAFDDLTSVGTGTVTLAIGLFAIIVLLIGFDVSADYRSGTEPSHLVTEGVVMGLALLGVVALWRQFRFMPRRAQQLTVDLAAAQPAAERFRGA